MIIKKAVYKTSVVKAEDILQDGQDIAFVGRSNVGKSSLLNALCNIKKLAKVSGTPGRTRMINYFDINDEFRFVDLPGYGFHLAGKQNEIMWSSLMEDYLNTCDALLHVFMLVDIRHAPSELDKRMLKYLCYTNRSFTVVATKADKIAKSKVSLYVAEIAKHFGITSNNIVACSSESKYNLDKILDIAFNCLNDK